jgi:transcription elongation factor Elf1
MKKKRPKRRRDADPSSAYICPTCGEEIVVPIDPTQGSDQEYVEDCPVCCHPNVIHVEIEERWEEARVWAESE